MDLSYKRNNPREGFHKWTNYMVWPKQSHNEKNEGKCAVTEWLALQSNNKKVQIQIPDQSEIF